MQFLTPKESAQWCLQHGYPVTEDYAEPDLNVDNFIAGRFPIPSDAGKRIALCRMLIESVWSQEPQCLLWTTQWSVWPSGEHFPLAQNVRHSFGEDRPLADAPGHIFHFGEIENALTFLVLSCLFLWDTSLMVSGGTTAISLSHDEYGVVFSKQPTKIDEFRRRFAQFDIAFEKVS